MTAYAEQMGFNSNVEFDGVISAKSVYDVTDASDYELGWSGVGQHTVLETPINMAMRSAAIANGGTPVMPYYIQSVDGVTKNETKLAKPMLNKETADKLYEMMDYTAAVSYGKDRLSELAHTGQVCRYCLRSNPSMSKLAVSLISNVLSSHAI